MSYQNAGGSYGPMDIPKTACDPGAASGVAEALGLQDSALTRLEETIGRLYARADLFLRPESPTGGGECSEKDVPRSYAANAIGGSNYRVDVATRRLRDLIDRLD